MITKKESLDKAFESALKVLNCSPRENATLDVEEKVLAMEMKEFARKNELNFTDDEIHATIVAGIETLNKAGADFRLQTWSMK